MRKRTKRSLTVKRASNFRKNESISFCYDMLIIMNISDKELVEKYLEGDEEALKVLIGRYLKPVFNFVYHYAGGNRQDAEEIAQDAFIKMWRSLKKFDPEKGGGGENAFRNWVFKIARNTAFDFLRKKYSADRQKKILLFSEMGGDDEEGNFLDNVPDPDPLSDEIFERAELAKDLAATINKLPLKYREVLILHYNDHVSLQEIAEISGESPNTVKSRHLRGIERLRKEFLHPKSGLSRIK